MRAHYLIVPLAAVALAGCTVYRPVPVAYTSPAPVIYVSPAYVAAPDTVTMGAPPADWSLRDSDGDGFNNGIDLHPYDARFR